MIVVKDYFTACEERFPEKRSELRRISLCLRRGGILTMEALCQMQRETPEKVTAIRDIGEKSSKFIAVICRQYEDSKQ
ncbi:MAG: hypothetical protein PHE02_08445 [Lachnospiraceae bacterium]|nr:hypothetical protein [Lachnospiraceae bacterium]